MIEIELDNSDIVKIGASEYDKCKQDSNFFTIYKEKELVSVYNLNYVKSIKIKTAFCPQR